MIRKKKQIFLFSLFSLLGILFLCNSIGKSYLISFVHIVKGDDVVEENLSNESEDEILHIDEEDNFVKEDSWENLVTHNKATNPQETVLDSENTLEDFKEKTVEEGEENEVSNDISIITPPVKAPREGTRAASPVIVTVNVINNQIPTIHGTRRANDFQFTRINDDGSQIFTANENCAPDFMSCDIVVDSTYSALEHFFNLEHEEFFDYRTAGFSCVDNLGSPVALPVPATNLGNPSKCSITYEYVDPRITITTPVGIGTFGNADINFGAIYGSGVFFNGPWEVMFTAGGIVRPSVPCYDEIGFVSKCYTFDGECSGNTLNQEVDKICNVWDGGFIANIPVNSYLVKNYPPQNDDDYLDATDSSLVPTFYASTEDDLFPHIENSVLGDVNTTKKHIGSTIQIYENSSSYSVYSTPINITNTNPIGYEYLGCRERPNNNLSNELNFANATSVNSEIDCFYKVLPIQLTISKSNNSLLDGINAGDIVEYKIEIKAPNDSLPGTYLSNQTTLFDKLSTGITYQSGSFLATSSRRGNLPLSEPTYSGNTWATWDLGDIQEGEIVTLKYKAVVASDISPGNYTDQAYVKGMSVTNEEVLGIGSNNTEFVSTNILVVESVIPSSTPGSGQNHTNTGGTGVTQTSTPKKLPNTGASIYIHLLGILSILIGIPLLKIKKNKLTY